MLTTVLLILLIIGLVGGAFVQGGAYRYEGFGMGGILLVVLIVLLATGRL